MGKKNFSAGLLLYAFSEGELRVLLVHPGGPYFERQDAHAWGVPKGELDEGEAPLDAAKREFREETGHNAPEEAQFIDLGEITQPNRKVVRCWAFEGVFDPAGFRCNTCFIEWPPRSGEQLEIPENDRAELFNLETAQQKIRQAQWPLVERLAKALEIQAGI